ncbi:MAG: hypothetical protein KBT30_00235 [Clostridiales bacterium]|nr:hypothetical protein [Candidatus Apopatousia equi]
MNFNDFIRGITEKLKLRKATLSSGEFYSALQGFEKIKKDNSFDVYFEGNVLTSVMPHNMEKGFHFCNFHFSTLSQKLALVYWYNNLLGKDNTKTLKFVNEKFKYMDMGRNLPVRVNKNNFDEIVVNVNLLKYSIGFEAITSLLFAYVEADLLSQKSNENNVDTFTNSFLYEKYDYVDMQNQRLKQFTANHDDMIEVVASAVVQNQYNYMSYTECREKALQKLESVIGWCPYERENFEMIKTQCNLLSKSEQYYADFMKNTEFAPLLPLVMNFLDTSKKYTKNQEFNLSKQDFEDVQ